MNQLLVSYYKENCGVYQYGESIARSMGISHLKVGCVSELIEELGKYPESIIVLNWHPGTLGAIMTNDHVADLRGIKVCLLHEFDLSLLNSGAFDAYIFGDPSSTYTATNYFRLPRLLKNYSVESVSEPRDRPTIGTFGFGVDIKGYDRVIEWAHQSFCEAKIRLHIPRNWAVDPDGIKSEIMIERIKDNLPIGYSLEISTEWKSDQQLVQWLSQNDINVFPYENTPHTGISSSTDWAIMARRPFAVSRCGLFRHLHHLPVIGEERSLAEILSDGSRIADQLMTEWSEEIFKKTWLEIMDNIVKTRQKDFLISSEKKSMDELKELPYFNSMDLRGVLQNFNRRESLETKSQALQDSFVLWFLQKKRNGKYLEVGANHPVKHSNTYMLSKEFGWSGISIEYVTSYFSEWKENRPNDSLVIANALTIDYEEAFNLWFDSNDQVIDYIQLDIEPSIHTLEVLKKLPLTRYRFNVMTFETDVYSGDLRARNESRKILSSLGYKLLCPDVLVECSEIMDGPFPFEDWWVDSAIYNEFLSRDQHNVASLMARN